VRVVVGRVVRPHGVRGEAVVEARTDRPEQRFAPGRVLLTDRGAELRVVSSRPHGARVLVQFDGVADRDAVDAMRGVLLEAEVDDVPDDDEPDVYADVSLVGLEARLVSGEVVGVVRAVEHLPMQDLLVVRLTGGRDVRVPFVAAIVPSVDVEAGAVLLDPPGGLLDEETAP
jgi:16S rRNA processing protein RimM